MSGHVHCCEEVDYDSVAAQAITTFLASPEAHVEISDAIYKALRQYDEGKRLARDARAALNSQYPQIKRGTGRSGLTRHLTEAVVAALSKTVTP